jgi:hypothetical protein
MSVKKYNNILNLEEIENILNNPIVINELGELENNNVKKFNLVLSDSVKNKLQSILNLQNNTNTFPMRWIKGDTLSHKDYGMENFITTSLIYLTNSSGNLIIDNNNYDITAGCAYQFNEGLLHETINTGTIPRLLIGPMSENIMAVGFPQQTFVNYYNPENILIGLDRSFGSITVKNITELSPPYTPPPTKVFKGWGTSPNSNVVLYNPGDIINNQITNNLYVILENIPVICFNEGTTILTNDGYIKIEDLKEGDMVKTLKHDFVPISKIYSSKLNNPEHNERIADRLYILSKEKYPELNEDLILTGGHSLLVDQLTKEEIESMLKILDTIYMTDGKLRLLACSDNNAMIYNKSGEFNIWHIALENINENTNYGIYANGLLVESCAIKLFNNITC